MRHFVILFVLIGIVGMLLVPVNISHGLPSFLNCKYDDDYIISTNKLEFVPGETFVVNVRTMLDDPSFEMIVINPKGQEVFADVVDVDTDGSAQGRFHIPDDAQKGTWTVFLTANPSHLQEVIFIGVDETPQSLLSIKPSSVNHQYKVEDASFLLAGISETDIQVNVLEPDNGKKHIYIITLPLEGKCNFTLDLDGYKPGVYGVEITDHVDDADTMFTVGLQPTTGVIAVSLLSDSYFFGDDVFVSIETAPGVDLTVDVMNPSGDVTSQFDVTSEKNGTVHTTFALPESGEEGTWKVRATASPNFDTVEFVVEKSQNKTSPETLDSKQGVSGHKESLQTLDPDPVLDLWNKHAEIIDGTIVSKTIYPSMGKGITEFHVKINKFFKPLSKNTESITLFASADSGIPDILNKGDRSLIYIEPGNQISRYSVKVDDSTYCEPRDYIQIAPVLPNDPNQLVRGAPTLPFDWTDQCIADYYTEDPNFWVYREYRPPMQQWMVHNIPMEQQRCSGDGEDFVSVQKIGNSNYKYCVKPDSVPKMVERGWAKMYDTEKNHFTSEQQTQSIVIIPKGAVIEGNENLIPKEITVVLGKNNTVTWINQDDTAHGISSDDASWGSRGILHPGDSFSVTFNRTGIYDYHGQPHPWETGTVIVLEE